MSQTAIIRRQHQDVLNTLDDMEKHLTTAPDEDWFVTAAKKVRALTGVVTVHLSTEHGANIEDLFHGMAAVPETLIWDLRRLRGELVLWHQRWRSHGAISAAPRIFREETDRFIARLRERIWAEERHLDRIAS